MNKKHGARMRISLLISCFVLSTFFLVVFPHGIHSAQIQGLTGDCIEIDRRIGELEHFIEKAEQYQKENKEELRKEMDEDIEDLTKRGVPDPVLMNKFLEWMKKIEDKNKGWEKGKRLFKEELSQKLLKLIQMHCPAKKKEFEY